LKIVSNIFGIAGLDKTHWAMALNVFNEILSWAPTDLQPWQNELIRRLFARPNLTASDRDDLFELAKADYGLSKDKEAAKRLIATDLPAPPSPGDLVQLTAIKDVKNVNALKEGQSLTFGKQLTVIFGENGSGKSGYARVMKKAFKARAVDPLLPNVYVKPTVPLPATATFVLEVNGTNREEVWTDGSPGASSLSRFAVFDSRCARVYVTGDNQLEFAPYGLDLIDGLAKETAEVKKRFQEIATNNSPDKTTLTPLIDATSSGKFFESINSATSDDKLREKATWTDKDESELATKQEELAKLKASSAQAQRRELTGRKKQLEELLAEVQKSLVTIDSTAHTDLNSLLKDIQTHESAVAASAAETLADSVFNGLSSDVWRELLASAEKFSREFAYREYPFPARVDDARCVLCQQVLDRNAQSRLERFWKFINDESSAKLAKGKGTLAAILERLAGVPAQLSSSLSAYRESLPEEMQPLFKEIENFFPEARERADSLRKAAETNDWTVLAKEPESPVSNIQAAVAAVERAIGQVADDSTFATLLAERSTDVDELRSRKRLNKNLDMVLTYLARLRTSSSAALVASKISTTAITVKSGELHAKLVTEQFKQRIMAELKPLSLARLRVGIGKKNEKGKVFHKVTVDGVIAATPENVFSEGERTALSLACFFAELKASADNCGIILDDPISSLDLRVRDKIVKRLAVEARERQVIVFTHDLVFYRELSAAAKEHQVDLQFQYVEALGSVTGILSTNAPLPLMKVNDRINYLQKILSEAKAAEAIADVPKYQSSVRNFYEALRATWERSVEELLFNQVVQRFEKGVKTLSLTGVVADRELKEAVFSGMTRSSAMIESHDHAVAVGAPLPESSDLKRDLDELVLFTQKHKAKKKVEEEALAHLK
jgi:energy-coupling factor transporter ATP-binding protein EcfA2